MVTVAGGIVVGALFTNGISLAPFTPLARRNSLLWSRFKVNESEVRILFFSWPAHVFVHC